MGDIIKSQSLNLRAFSFLDLVYNLIFNVFAKELSSFINLQISKKKIFFYYKYRALEPNGQSGLDFETFLMYSLFVLLFRGLEQSILMGKP